jgi:LysW-gamma-L-lysine carboxypeptidase
MNAPAELETLTGLLLHYSPTGEEGAAVHYLVERMARLGYDQAYADQAGNAIGIIGQGPRQVVLLGHIDTVPGEIPIRIEGDILFGRGAVDAKGPLAAFVDAAIAGGVRAGWQFVVVGAVGEEGDSRGACYLAPHYRPDFAIIGEPSRWERITLGYMGNASDQICMRRPMAHGASGQESACEAVFHAWHKLEIRVEDYNQGRQRAFDRLHLNLDTFSSGKDGFEEWADARLEARLPLALPPESWQNLINEVIQPEPPVRVSIEPSSFSVAAYECPKNTPLVRAFLSAIRSTGGNPSFVLKTGTADLNVVAPLWNCPILAYGPGDSALDHTPHESISLVEYTHSVGVLRSALERLTAS